MKKNIVIILASILSFAVASSVHARGTATGTVSKLTASGSVTNIFLSTAATAVNGETRPGCATRDDIFTLSSSQKNQLAILLTAMALGSEVKINGNDMCTNKSDAEDASSVQIVSSGS